MHRRNQRRKSLIGVRRVRTCAGLAASEEVQDGLVRSFLIDVESMDTCYTLERLMLETIPLARAMGLRVIEFDDNRLALSAPLAANVNDKGCAFGGSLVSLMTLSCWGLTMLKLDEAGIKADVFVQDSEIRYLAPVWDELIAEAHLDPGQDWSGFIAQLNEKGKARVTLHAEVTTLEGGGVACRFTGQFVAKRHGART